MTANITSVTVTFGHGIKREEYGPTKKAEVSLTAAVAENEDGELVLAEISSIALARVATMLDAPKPIVPDRAVSASIAEANATADPPKRRGRPPKDDTGAQTVDQAPAAETTAAPASESDKDEWSAGSEAIQVTDQEILSACSKRAQELGGREKIVTLIASFATRTDGPPFKVQEIPQNQRKDFLQKLAALTV